MQRSATAVVACLRWTTASSVPYPVFSAIVMAMLAYSSMPLSLSVAMDAVASLAICHCLCTHSHRVPSRRRRWPAPVALHRTVFCCRCRSYCRYSLHPPVVAAANASRVTPTHCSRSHYPLPPVVAPAPLPLPFPTLSLCVSLPSLCCSERHRHRRAMTFSASSTPRRLAQSCCRVQVTRTALVSVSSVPRHSQRASRH